MRVSAKEVYTGIRFIIRKQRVQMQYFEKTYVENKVFKQSCFTIDRLFVSQ